ncbi:Imm3 family immunity protein [Paenibacillus rhizoplanae]
MPEHPMISRQFEKEGILEDIIVSTAMGEIIFVAPNSFFIGNLNSIEELLIKYNPNELSGLISSEDLADLTTRINNSTFAPRKKWLKPLSA